MLTTPLLWVIAAITLVGSSETADAAGPTGGGFGGVQCGQAYTPGCVVIAGIPGSTTTGAATVPRTATAAGNGGCAGIRNPQFGCVSPGCQVTAQTLACPADVAVGAPGGAPIPMPTVLARRALGYLRLPSPIIHSSPAPTALQLTRLPVWLWIALSAWQPRSATATVPGEAVAATATPVSAAWQMGDGTTVTCHGPGTPYRAAGNPDAASPDCGHTYTVPSGSQPGSAYHVTVTITWDITWHGTGGAGGTLPPLTTTAAAAMRVAESQALNIAGGQP